MARYGKSSRTNANRELRQASPPRRPKTGTPPGSDEEPRGTLKIKVADESRCKGGVSAREKIRRVTMGGKKEGRVWGR